MALSAYLFPLDPQLTLNDGTHSKDWATNYLTEAASALVARRAVIAIVA